MATETTAATAAYFAATADGAFDHQRDAYEAGYDAGRAEERERIIGSDRESLQLMLESIASLPNVGPDAEACGRVVRRLLEGAIDGQ